MQNRSFLGVLFAILLASDKIFVSSSSVYKKSRVEGDIPFPTAESYGTALLEVGNGEEEKSSYLGKRAIETEAETLSKAVGRDDRHVHFAPEVMEEVVYDPSDPLAEQNYIEALFKKDFVTVKSLKRQGLTLSNSKDVYHAINKILTKERVHKTIIDALFKYQPQVLIGDYPNHINILKDASQATIDYIIKFYGKRYRDILLNIFTEALENPKIVLSESFFKRVKTGQLWKLINFADQYGSPSLIQNCYLLPSSLEGLNENGETFFTEAVKNLNLTRIGWLIQRKDAAKFILSPNSQGETPVSAAMKLYKDGIDPDCSAFLSLVPVLFYIYKTTSNADFTAVLEQFNSFVHLPNVSEEIYKILFEKFEGILEYARKH